MKAPIVTSVIIRTECLEGRAASLDRAIRSVTAEQEPAALPIIVHNGHRAHPPTLEALRRRSDIRLFEMGERDFSDALRVGREQVDTPFFCFLDDDDCYLPGSNRERVEAMRRHPAASVIVTTGLRNHEGRVVAVPRSPAFDPTDLFASLMKSSWLSACGGFFRTQSVSAALFDNGLSHNEWTYIAFRLTRESHVVFEAGSGPHFEITDTPGSMSKSIDQTLATPAILQRMGEADLTPRERRLLDEKLRRCWHGVASVELRRRRIGAAWRAHRRSLLLPGGWRYILFTRKLLRFNRSHDG